jgi:hypothetical protein
MRIIFKLLSGFAAFVVAFFLLMLGLSEIGGEVVTLTKPSEGGGQQTVRLWIVDQGGSAWLEHGDPSSFWIQNLSKNPELTVERHGKVQLYEAKADPDSHELVHRLLREKYGTIDAIIRLLGGEADRCPGIPVHLALK